MKLFENANATCSPKFHKYAFLKFWLTPRNYKRTIIVYIIVPC